MYPQSMFWSKNKKNNNKNLLKIFNFYVLKILCILHGHVLVLALLSTFQYEGDSESRKTDLMVAYRITVR